jgi:beta-N-acetylhexosaminidase
MREVERLSTSELCGQLLLLGFDGHSAPDWLLESVAERSLGGVILFARNIESPEQTLQLCKQLHRAAPAGYPIFVSVDQEGGRVQRLRDGVLQLPPMRALGQRNDLEFTGQVAAELGRQLLSLGFNLNFAPVADVDSNPKNPVIGDRSFSADPRVVTEHVRAFARAQEDQGVVACLKHFPGHGDTSLDSHLELPYLDKSATDLRRVEFYPFERACRDAHGVMTAHVVFSAMDRAPATLSGRLLGLLRKEFAFEGIVFSDDLEMKALAQHWPIEETAVRAVQAGCDMLLVCKEREQQQRAHQALLSAANASVEFLASCRRAVSRSLAIRQRFPQRPVASASQLRQVLNSKHANALRELLS